ncbi:unnamed protein product [Lepeophtheirus salmonis]|uniref:(salmon louse) hypothetical protein n=1 Tax=Lepeophtheirus salmonis TaxID=72036 RepID=A0A7R8CTB2_LEPSM|nr:unnamed protein product [Lepeophtheirus salmonis]CAF2924245.1 unnamed protein product [Lepeophtheirus salmonis]
MKDFICQFENVNYKLVEEKIKLPVVVLAFILLIVCNLDRNQKHLILFGMKEVKFEEMISTLRRIFTLRDFSNPVQDENPLMFTRMKKNPVNEPGEVTRFTAYSPFSNGLCERTNDISGIIVSRLVEDDITDVDVALDLDVAARNYLHNLLNISMGVSKMKEPVVQDIIEANKMFEKVTTTNVRITLPRLEDLKTCKITCYTDASFANVEKKWIPSGNFRHDRRQKREDLSNCMVI